MDRRRVAAAPSAALWAAASRRWSHPTLLVAALALQAVGIALPAVAGGPVAALIGAVLFGGTFIGVSTVALAAGRLLAFPRAVAVLTTGYSVGQIVGPLLVSPLLHQGFRLALITSSAVVSLAAVAAIGLRVGSSELSRGGADRLAAATSAGRQGPTGPPRAERLDESQHRGLTSARRHTSDQVHTGAGPITGRRTRSGGVASFWPRGCSATAGGSDGRGRRTWSR